MGQKKRREKAAAEAAAAGQPAPLKLPAVVFADLSPFYVPAVVVQRLNHHYEAYKAATPQNANTSLREFAVLCIVGTLGLLDQTEAEANEQNDKLAAPRPVDDTPDAAKVAVEASKRIAAMKAGKGAAA